MTRPGEQHSIRVTDIGYHYEQDVAHYILKKHLFYDRFYDLFLLNNLCCCNSNQIRRNKRMIDQGLEPIDLIRLHDLRHTHSILAKRVVPTWHISDNMGHKLPEVLNNTTTKFYWLDRHPDRDNIIKFFDEIININWDEAMNIPINRDNGKISINGSGHLVISKEETERRKNNGLNFVFKEEDEEVHTCLLLEF